MVFRLPGGNEDNDLWVDRDETEDGEPILRSCWVPSDEQRQAITNGANIELFVWGDQHPPVAMDTCDYPLGARPRE
jgi:hypothetical protein